MSVDLEELTDRELGDECESAIIGAAIMPASKSYQDRVDAIYAECARRGKGIYQRAWNRAVRSQGYGHMVEEPGEGAA